MTTRCSVRKLFQYIVALSYSPGYLHFTTLCHQSYVIYSGDQPMTVISPCMPMLWKSTAITTLSTIENMIDGVARAKEPMLMAAADSETIFVFSYARERRRKNAHNRPKA